MSIVCLSCLYILYSTFRLSNNHLCMNNSSPHTHITCSSFLCTVPYVPTRPQATCRLYSASHNLISIQILYVFILLACRQQMFVCLNMSTVQLYTYICVFSQHLKTHQDLLTIKLLACLNSSENILIRWRHNTIDRQCFIELHIAENTSLVTPDFIYVFVLPRRWAVVSHKAPDLSTSSNPVT